jgi:hypothetical protein
METYGDMEIYMEIYGRNSFLLCFVGNVACIVLLVPQCGTLGWFENEV